MCFIKYRRNGIKLKNRNAILIKEGYKALNNKRFPEAIALLEKAISNRHDDPYPFLLLCISYLLNNRFNDAELTIKSLRKIDPYYLPLVQLESFLFLKSASSIHPVIAAYIDRLEQFPKDKYLKNALKNIRKVKKFSDFQKKAKLNNFVLIPGPGEGISEYTELIEEESGPKEEKPKNKLKNHNHIYRTIKFTLLLILFSAAGFVLYNYYDYIKIKILPPREKSSFPIDSIDIDLARYDLIDKIKIEKSNVFYYSNEEVINDFKKAKSLIKNEQYNDALIMLNKIQNSNANYRVKERLNFLFKFISDIEYRNYEEIPASKVFKAPYLYKGVFVKWKGKITNLRKKENKLMFNLLIDYKKDDIFSGIIDVYSENTVQELKNGDIVVIQGAFLNTLGNTGRFYLVSEKINKLSQ